MLCFDTETTGLDADDEIVQLTITDAGNSSVPVYNNFFAPLNKTSFDGASQVTGLYYDQPVPMYPDGPLLCEYPPIGDPDTFDEIQNLLNSTGDLMGYHVAYDAKMMEAAGFDMSSFTYYDPMYAFAIFYWITHSDEQYTTRGGKVRDPWLEWKHQYVNRNLTFAAGYFNISFGAHDSSEDVRATIELYHCLCAVEDEIFGARYPAYDENGDPILDTYGDVAYESEYDGERFLLLYPDNTPVTEFIQAFDLASLYERDA